MSVERRDFFSRRGETKNDTETKYQPEEQRSIEKKDRVSLCRSFLNNENSQRHERLLEIPFRESRIDLL